LWAQEAVIRGYVKDTSGKPIESATISFLLIEKADQREVKTDKSGFYFMRGLFIGTYKIRCFKEGYIPVEDTRRLKLGKNELDIVMQNEAEVERKMLEEIGGQAYAEGYDAFNAGDYKSAIDLMKKTVEATPENKNAYLLIARSYFELKEYDSAIENYKKVLALEKDHLGAMFDLGSIYVQKGDFNAASENFKKILSLKPDDPEAHYNIGIIFFQANQTEKAIEELKTALKLREDFALAHKSLGYAFIQMNQIQEAIFHLEKYIELDPQAKDIDKIKEIITILKKSFQK
jgi:tetratricopeptide (TPR) repeat protein